MDEQLIDWIEFCEKRKTFDKSHFYTLFFEGKAENGRRSEEELKTIFQYFPHTDELLLRMNNFTNGEDAQITDYRNYIIENTSKDLDQKRIILKEEDEEELFELIQKPIKYVEDINRVVDNRLNNWPDAEIHSVVSDFFIEKTPADDLTNALEEAFYGFTHNYELTRYLMYPLIDTDLNLDYYFNIWKVGGDYSVTENGVIVSKHVTSD